MKMRMEKKVDINVTRHTGYVRISLRAENCSNVQLSAKKRPMVEISSLCYLKGHVDNAIHWINCYSVDNVACFANTYPLDSN